MTILGLHDELGNIPDVWADGWALLIMGMISIFLMLAKSTSIELWIFSRLCFHPSIQQRQKKILVMDNSIIIN
jgi:hypothetical protein